MNPSLTKAKTATEEADKYESVTGRVIANSLGWIVHGFNDSLGSHFGTRPATAICAQTNRMAEANRQIGRLWSVANFGDDWDGAGSSAPNIDSIKAAEDIIYKLAGADFPIPIASIGADGHSTLFWCSSNSIADVDIEDGKAYYLIKREGKEIEAEEELVPNYIPLFLMTYLMGARK